MNKITLKLPKCKEFVGVARMALAAHANTFNLPMEKIDDIKICISEACDTMVLHSNSCDTFYTIESFYIDSCFQINMIDENGKFDIKDYENISCEEIKKGGFGIYIMMSLADDFSIEKIGNTQIMTLKFKM